MSKQIFIFDTTLRDGEQSPGISLNPGEKLEIAKQLAKMGVDVIEAGFPVTSAGDFEAVKAIAGQIKGSTIVALARAIDKDIETAAEALKNAQDPCIHTFISTSDIHIEKKLKKTKAEVLEMAEAAVKKAKSYYEKVEFSPEDATRTDFEYLVKIIKIAISAGATTINIPDTVGYSLPEEFGSLIKNLRKEIPELDDLILSVHCHNDLGLAVANSVEAVQNGATQIECAVNGLGERAGNAALEEVVMILDTRKRLLGVDSGIKTDQITKTSKLVSNLTGYKVQYNKAIVGANAFAHSSGIHADGYLKERQTYEIIDPQKIGLTDSKLILGKTSGRHLFASHLEKMGYSLNEESLNKAFTRFKDLADKKAEITDSDLEALIADEVRAVEEIYKLEYLEVLSKSNESPRAKIKLMNNSGLIEEEAQGDGPVDAICNAISNATKTSAKLLSYNVSSITGGLDAQGDVSINLEIDGKSVLGRGVSTDIIEASAKAYLNAINKALTQ